MRSISVSTSRARRNAPRSIPSTRAMSAASEHGSWCRSCRQLFLQGASSDALPLVARRQAPRGCPPRPIQHPAVFYNQPVFTFIRLGAIALVMVVSVSSKRMPDGKQWLTENLNVTLNGSYCYDNAERNCQQYGRLYTW